jgi:ribonuclease HI
LILQVDGALGRGPRGTAGVGVVIRTVQGEVVFWRSRQVAAQTCNEAEYQALITGLQTMRERFPTAAVRCLSDSRVVIDQMTGRAAVHAGPLKPLHASATRLARQFRTVEYVAIPRELNRLADALAWEAVRGVLSSKF